MSAALPHVQEPQTARLQAAGRHAWNVSLVLPLALTILALAATIVWRLSLRHVQVDHLDDYGLPPALPASWYLALLACVAGAIASVVMPRYNTALALLYIAAITLILFGTVPALSAQPHYAWVYKHIGVVRYFEAQGKANASIDIYNRWPGFFALAAAFSHIVGTTNPAAYAGWADAFFSFLDTVLMMGAVKVITRSARIAAGAGVLFALTNWVGQTYYSPQAFAFVLGLALLTVMLRQLRTSSSGYSARLTRWIERLARTPQLPPEPSEQTHWPRSLAIGATLVLDAVIVASHQLTPYMLLVSVALLMLAGILRPWWVLGAMAAMTFAYLAANFQFIRTHYGVFTSIDPFNNAQDSTLTQVPSAGKTFNTHAELLLIAALWLGTAIAVARLARQGLMIRALPLLILALSPFFVLFGQNYGGEASLRIILFSSPWCVGLISWAFSTVTRGFLRSSLMLGAALAYTALFIPSYLGQEEFDIISSQEMSASEWFYNHGRRGSVLVLSAPGFPYKYGATYPYFSGPEGDANPNLLSSTIFQSKQLGRAQIPYVIDRIHEYSKHGYVAFTKDQTAYAEALGITPPGALAHLEAAVASSPRFRLWYGNRYARIYELREQRSRPHQAQRRKRRRHTEPRSSGIAAPAGVVTITPTQRLDDSGQPAANPLR